MILHLEELNRPVDFGRTPYYIGCIQAQLGNQKQAMGALEQAFAEYCPFERFYYEWDILLRPLFEYLPFQDFIAPRPVSVL